jgi:hypothetical protein
MRFHSIRGDREMIERTSRWSMRHRIAELEAERDKLLDVVRMIVDEYDDQVHGPMIHAIKLARAALGETER